MFFKSLGKLFLFVFMFQMHVLMCFFHLLISVQLIGWKDASPK